MNDTTCSDEHELTGERGASLQYGDWDNGFRLHAQFDPQGHPLGNDAENETVNLGVDLWYSPEFAATLADDDRATLLVKSENGSTMMESVSAVPYLDDVRSFRDGDVLCKSVYLKLDGTERPLPVHDPDAPPTTR